MRFRNPDKIVIRNCLLARKASPEKQLSRKINVHIAAGVNTRDCLKDTPEERVATARHGLEGDCITAQSEVLLFEETEALAVGDPLKLGVTRKVFAEQQFLKPLKVHMRSFRARTNVQALVHDIGWEHLQEPV